MQLLLPVWARATDLTLRFVDSEQLPVQVSRAELLAVAWGDVRRFELVPQGATLKLDLSPGWLKSRWPERFTDLEKAYVYVEAPGFAPVRSDPFVWLGSHSWHDSPGVTATEVSFPNASSVALSGGDHATLTLALREPLKRTITLVDDKGMPLAGVKLRAFMFWSASNHCGVLAGADPLGIFQSDDRGEIDLPDGDFEYALEIEAAPGLFRDAGREDSRTLISYLRPGDRILHIHVLPRRVLSVHIRRDGRPAANVTLNGSLGNCGGCGVCWGPLGMSDAEGRITIQDFEPETLDALCVCSAQGRAIWSISPKDLSDGPLEIDLTSVRRAVRTTSPCCPR
jgi:hypothetical protein